MPHAPHRSARGDGAPQPMQAARASAKSAEAAGPEWLSEAAPLSALEPGMPTGPGRPQAAARSPAISQAGVQQQLGGTQQVDLKALGQVRTLGATGISKHLVGSKFSKASACTSRRLGTNFGVKPMRQNLGMRQNGQKGMRLALLPALSTAVPVHS